jgi:hypothetical protein
MVKSYLVADSWSTAQIRYFAVPTWTPELTVPCSADHVWALASRSRTGVQRVNREGAGS